MHIHICITIDVSIYYKMHTVSYTMLSTIIIIDNDDDVDDDDGSRISKIEELYQH